MFSYSDPKCLRRGRRSVFMIVQNGVLNDSRVLKTAQTVRRLGYRVTVFGRHLQPRELDLEYSTFTIKLLPHPSLRLEAEGRWEPDVDKRDYSEIVRIDAEQLEPHLRDGRPDIVHTHDMNGLAVGADLFERGMLENVAWVHDVHEYVRGLTIIPPALQSYCQSVQDKAIGWPDALTSVSEPLATLLKTDHALARAPRIVLNTPRRSDFDPDDRRDIRGRLGLARDVPLLVYGGNINPMRGVDLIVDALARRRSDHLALVTNSRGPAVDALKEQAKRLGVDDRVHYHAYVPFTNVTSFLRSASVGMSPIRSYLNVEIALPTKLFEYIHAGLPVVSSQLRTMEAFIERESCGTVFPLDDPSTLAEKIEAALTLAATPDFSEKQTALARRFCWEEQEKVLEEIYDEIDPIEPDVHPRARAAGRQEGHGSRVAQLPVAQAGQAPVLASGLRSEGVTATSISVKSHVFGYRSDLILDEATMGEDGRRRMVRDLARDYDIFHFHVRSLISDGTCSFGTGQDLMMLRLLDRRVFFHFRGTEIRMESVFRRHCRYHYVDEDPDDVFIRNKEKTQRAFRDFVSGTCHGVFVTDPELLTYVPEAIMVPRALDLEAWPDVGIKSGRRPKIVHAPSRRSFKGTGSVLAAIERLKDDGFTFDFQLVEGLSHDEAKMVYRDADIVVDQLRIGWYGLLAVEAMALGKAVIAYIRDDLRHYLPSPPPLKIANPDNLYHVLRGLLEDPDGMARLGRRGRSYVEDVHDARKIARFLTMVYADADGSAGDPVKISDFLNLQAKGVSSSTVDRRLRLIAGRSSRRINRWTQRLLPRRRFSQFVEVLRRDGPEAAVKRTVKFLRET